MGFRVISSYTSWRLRLQLRTSSNQRLAGVIGLILDKVLDEAASQIFRLGIPFSGISIGVARIQNAGVNENDVFRRYSLLQ